MSDPRGIAYENANAVAFVDETRGQPAADVAGGAGDEDRGGGGHPGLCMHHPDAPVQGSMM